MKPAFADTSYFVALVGPNDSLHERAVEWSERWLGRIITTQYVLVETGSMLCRPEDRSAFVELVRVLQTDRSVQIVHASNELFQNGFDLFASRSDKEWSLVDCISMALVTKRNVKDALTADHHFTQAGFRALLCKPSK